MKKKTLVPFIVFLLGMCLVGLIVYKTDAIEKEQKRTTAQLNATTYGERIKNEITNGIEITDTLQQILISENGAINYFDTISKNIMSDSIESIQLAPNGVVTDIYPAKGNEAGKIDLLHDKDRGEISCYAIPGSWAGKQIEKALDERNLKKANLLHLTVVPLSIGIPSALLVFIALFFGADGINSVLNMIPEVVLNGFNVAAGVLSCVGLALLIKIMSNNKILPYLFLGFVAVMYLGMDVIGVAVVGLCIAFLAVNNMQFEEEDDF